jgi:hypothetical protein
MDRLVFKQIDFDLAERIIASGPIKHPKPAKTKKTPRAPTTYRGAIRNERRVIRAEQLSAKRRAA